MRVFSADLATETNTFAPMPTGLSALHERAYYPAGGHPDTMRMHGGPLWAAREVVRAARLDADRGPRGRPTVR